MIVRKITAKETRRTDELFSIAFESPLLEEQEDAYPLEKYAAFLDDNETMTSCLSVTPFTVNFDGNPVKMAGIGGVSSLPHYRRTGGIRGCFETMLPELYKEGYLLSMLYPFSTNYYRKFGYEAWAHGARYELELSQLPVFPREGHCMLVDETNRESVFADIRMLTDHWYAQYNGMARLEERDYAFVTKADPYRKQEFVYVYYDEGESPAGYMVLHKEKLDNGQRMVCSRFVFSNPKGIMGLLTLAKTYQADHKSIVITLPDSLPLDMLIDEWSFGAVAASRSSLGMVRFVNVEAALWAAAYRGSGELTVAVRDAQIAENNGVFQVLFHEGHAQQVERTQQKAQLRMDISEFSRFLIGALDVSALAYSRRADGYAEDNHSLLEQVFYAKPCFLTEYF